MSTTRKNPRATDDITVAICGNPNCGKTTIFNALTGLRQHVGNYPGVTVEKVCGDFRVPGSDRRFTLLDIPGSYSLAAFSPDEFIAARALSGDISCGKNPDLIVCVIDATNLDRGLYLLFQVMQIGKPIVVALNMVDVIARKGIEIDCGKLSRKLGGIPVVPLVASKGKGLDLLLREIGTLADTPEFTPIKVYDSFTDGIVDELVAATATVHPGRQQHRHGRLPMLKPERADYCECERGRRNGAGHRHHRGNGCRTRAEYLRILFDKGGPAEQEYLREQGAETAVVLEQFRARLIEQFGALTAAETIGLANKAADCVEDVVTHTTERKTSRREHIDRVILHPILGPIILLTVMVLIFQSVFSWAAPVMDLVDSFFGFLGDTVAGSMPDGPLRSLLVNGVIGGVGSVLIFLPQIIILFLFIAVLEDSGYMPRAAFLVDRMFSWCGLSGKSFIPLLSSFACAIPGIMATRTIENRKLRFITIMVAPLMSCSARLPV
ncbi:MAG: ferrous iron transport protein B, partial [candidate division Zixibacteria bacterium]|nr:ferrous iron transport protein B [candidate division Zixibacteria bacterium]